MEPSQYKERNVMLEDNFSAQSEVDDISLSGIRVTVRRQDSKMAEVYLGKIENEKIYEIM